MTRENGTANETANEEDVARGNGVGGGVRLIYYIASGLVVAFLLSLILRKVGSNYAPVDGWGVDFFELSAGAMCIARYFSRPWRSSRSVPTAFPLVLGIGCCAWGLGDLILTIESVSGQNPSPPSLVDASYIWFFPLCYISLSMIIRREARGSQAGAWMDKIIAGLGVASIFAAYVVQSVLKAVGGVTLSSATSMAYPTGDLVLLALAVSGMAAVPKGRRQVLVLAAVAVSINAVGDTFNLLQPNSELGYVTNAAAWPFALLILSISAWVHPIRAGESHATRGAGFALPTVGAAAGFVVLASASVARVGAGAVALATATLLVAAVRMTVTVRHAQADSAARERTDAERQENLLKLLTEVATNAEMLAEASDGLTTTATDLSVGAAEASTEAGVVASASEVISARTQSVAAGTNQMAASITEIARSAEAASSVGLEAMRETEETNSTIAKLVESSAEIGKIVKVITTIAEQTNLLALNATIEAARAGDSGRGFAVVANEVKQLATETATATKEIGAMIEAIQADTAQSVEAMERISQIIGKINDLQTTIASAVEEQSATTIEVTRNVGEVTESSNAISEHIGVAADAARGAAGGASNALVAASDLSSMASALRNLVAEYGELSLV